MCIDTQRSRLQHPGNAAAENRIRVYLGYCGPESKYMDILSLSIGGNSAADQFTDGQYCIGSARDASTAVDYRQSLYALTTLNLQAVVPTVHSLGCQMSTAQVAIQLRRPRPSNPRPPKPDSEPPSPPDPHNNGSTMSSTGSASSFCLSNVKSKLRWFLCIPCRKVSTPR
ncbi:hypothetical protein VTP01DRAFT_6924 [Rhizomucor pusillus]|uniref:uncharacterized protein n=1 Tax=Rhizomucor pusillus TaxID=4840 RepID=UPI003743AEAD